MFATRLVTAASVLVVACGSAASPGSPGVTPRPSTPAASAPPATSTASSAQPSSCSPVGAVDAWPLARRAAQLVVAPALNGQVAAMGSTIAQGVGGVVLFGNAPSDLPAQLATAGRAAAIPLLVMADEEGGGVQRLSGLVDPLPWARQMAQTMTAAEVSATAARLGRQMEAVGVDVDLAPVLDLDAGDGPNDRDADGLRSFSADPTVATSDGLAFARGLTQSGVIPVVKHFPGLGGATPNTDIGPAQTAPLSALEQAGLRPFRAAVDAAMPAVMVSNATVPGLTTGPASLSPAAISGLLREQLGFHGLVLTDSLSAGAVSGAGYTLASAAAAAIAAGADLVLFGSTLTPAQTGLLSPGNVAASVSSIVEAVVGAVQSGRLASSRLDDAVLHVLTAKGVDPCRPGGSPG